MSTAVNVLALEHLAVIIIDIRVLEIRVRLGEITALAEHIRGGRDHGVVLRGVLLDALQVVLADAKAHAHNRDLDAVVGPGDVRRRRLVLAIDRRS